jgi:sulfite exporter TauE/SafE
MAAAVPVGLVMGLLPCGFLYAIALAAAGRGSVVEGGLIMLAFGLGTLPAMLLFGSAVHWLSATMRAELLRWAGFMVVFIGCYNLYQHIKLSGWL